MLIGKIIAKTTNLNILRSRHEIINNSKIITSIVDSFTSKLGRVNLNFNYSYKSSKHL